jgi:hypothetical protein
MSMKNLSRPTAPVGNVDNRHRTMHAPRIENFWESKTLFIKRVLAAGGIKTNKYY